MTKHMKSWSSTAEAVLRSAMTSNPYHKKSDRSTGGSTGLDRSSSTAFAWLSRRHSASLNLRRSVSSVSSRRHSSPIEVKAAVASSTGNNSDNNSENSSSSSSSPKSISKRWKKVVHKVLGNVEEEEVVVTTSTQENQQNNLKDGKWFRHPTA